MVNQEIDNRLARTEGLLDAAEMTAGAKTAADLAKHLEILRQAKESLRSALHLIHAKRAA